MPIKGVGFLVSALVLSVGASASPGGRYLCTEKTGQRHFASERSNGCEEIKLEPGWDNFGAVPSALVDVDPKSIVSQPDGKSMRVRFYLADVASDVNGKWKYDFLESTNKFYCGKRETRLSTGTYKLGGKVVYERSPTEAVSESVDAGTLNEALYQFLCESK